MAGSGTTLVTARLRGHKAIGCDTDPLAVLIARLWCADVDRDKCAKATDAVVAAARDRYDGLHEDSAYPCDADEETRSFVAYWFDAMARRKLRALADSISATRGRLLRDLLWCAFSRLIITKQMGASLAMDVSHSRPHKVYERAPIDALDRFPSMAARVAGLCPFDGSQNAPKARVHKRDARHLPFRDSSIDIVLTSPPYLNAIDYLRAHRMSLVWMGHKVCELREVRSSNVGAEVGFPGTLEEKPFPAVLKKMGASQELPERPRRMIARYVHDMDAVLAETSRVLKPGGQAVFVVGDSSIRGTFIRNSRAIAFLGKMHGLRLTSTRRRPLPSNRRYLPPPTSSGAGKQLGKRMREEVIISFRKTV